MFAGLTASIQTQNTYFNIVNLPTDGGRFVIPYNPVHDVLTTNSRTFTLMKTSGTANDTNYSKIFTNADSPSTEGGYGLTLGTSGTKPHNEYFISFKEAILRKLFNRLVIAKITGF